MWKASFKSLLSRKLRLLLSTTAVVLGVAFVAGSLIFTDTLSRSFTGVFASTVGDVVVRPAGGTGDDISPSSLTVPAEVVDQLARVEGAARADGNVTTFGVFAVGEDGKVVGGQGAPGLGGNLHDAPAGHGIESIQPVRGEAPDTPGEVAIDRTTVEKAGYELGQRVHLVSSGAEPVLRPRLVGVLDFPDGGSLGGASLVAFEEETAQRLFLGGRDAYTDVWVTAEEGVSQEELRDAVVEVLPAGLEAVTGDQAAEDNGGDLMEAISFLTTFLLVFAGIALVVGSFLIVNTFSILVAQRSRELALLRALGASRRQVTRSVLAEAGLLGVVGATLGLALGVVLAVGIRALFASFGLDLSGAPLVFRPRTVLAAYAVGVTVTLVAAYLPARRAGRVAPVEALRDDVAMPEEAVRRRVAFGTVLAVGGAAAMVLGLMTDAAGATWYVGGGILAVLLGVALAAPVLGRPVVALVAAVYTRLFGTVGRLAGQNALRNPRRTAATASALMVGLALVTTMAVVGDSAKSSIDRAVADQMHGDLLVSNAIGMPISPKVADDVEQVDGVATVSRLRYAVGETAGERQGLMGVEPDTLTEAITLDPVAGSLDDLVDGTVMVAEQVAEARGLAVGDTVDYVMPAGAMSYEVVAVYPDDSLLSYPYTTTLGTLADAGFTPADNFVAVTTEERVSAATVRERIEAATADMPMVTVKDQREFAEEQRAPVDQLLTMIYALLGLALVISVLGIVNTLALSVIERTRELGLLRAVGLERRQVRRMVRLEAVVVSLLGGLLGVGLGALFGLALTRSMRGEGLEVTSVPEVQVVAFVVASAVVGIVAAALPARRAARLDVLGAIATD